MTKDAQSIEVLGQQIDTLDNLAHALLMPLPAQIHVDMLRKSLPEAVAELKRGFTEVTGENPWV